MQHAHARANLKINTPPVIPITETTIAPSSSSSNITLATATSAAAAVVLPNNSQSVVGKLKTNGMNSTHVANTSNVSPASEPVVASNPRNNGVQSIPIVPKPTIINTSLNSLPSNGIYSTLDTNPKMVVASDTVASKSPNNTVQSNPKALNTVAPSNLVARNTSRPSISSPTNGINSTHGTSSNVTTSKPVASNAQNNTVPSNSNACNTAASPNSNILASTNTNTPSISLPTNEMNSTHGTTSNGKPSESVASKARNNVVPSNPLVPTISTTNMLSNSLPTNGINLTKSTTSNLTPSKLLASNARNNVVSSNQNVHNTVMASNPNARNTVVSSNPNLPVATTANMFTNLSINEPVRVWNGELLVIGKERRGALECYAEAYRVMERPFISTACDWPNRIEIRSSNIQPGSRSIIDMRAPRVHWVVRIGSSNSEALYRLCALAERLYSANNTIVIAIPGGGRLFLFGYCVNGDVHTLLGVFEPKPEVPRMRPVRVWRGDIVLTGFSVARRQIDARAFRSPPNKSPTRTVGCKWPKIELNRNALVHRISIEDQLRSPYAQWFVRFSPTTKFEELEDWWRAIYYMHKNQLAIEVNVPNTSNSVILIAHHVDNHGLSLCGVYTPSSNRVIPSIQLL